MSSVVSSHASAESTVGSVSASTTSRSKHWYPVLWRWHFYAGLFCIPFVITLSISGAIYLFKPWFDAQAFEPYSQLAMVGERSSANEQIQTALTKLPGSRFMSYQLPLETDDAVVISVLHQGERTNVTVNPWTLDVLHVQGYEDSFIRMVRTFHGELLAGNVGSILVELASCWAIVLIVTGLLMSWAKRDGLAGILYIRTGAGKRLVWRDLHSTLGWYVSVLALFLLITGLPWALVWGGAFKEIRQWSKPAPVQQSWSQGRKQEKQAWGPKAVTSVDLPSEVLQQATALKLAPPVVLSVANGEKNLWKAQSRHQNRPLRADAWIDGNSGNMTRMRTFEDKSALDRAIGIGIAAHEGHLFGWFNQLLGVFTALALVAISISGAVLWWRRKPADSLGAPPKLQGRRIPVLMAALLLFWVAFLPLLAISVVVILVCEWMLNLQRTRLSAEGGI